MDGSLVAYSDLTQLDGEPTSRATPRIERTPVGRSADEAAAALVVAALTGMAAMAGTAAIGLWIGCPTSVIVICSMIMFVLVLAIGAPSFGHSEIARHARPGDPAAQRMGRQRRGAKAGIGHISGVRAPCILGTTLTP